MKIDRIVLNVIKKFEKRADDGLKKYGVTLERTDLSTLDWINEAQQEAMDFCLYLERLSVDIKNIDKVKEAKRLLFIGKVSQIIGFDKTSELLKEVEQEIKYGI
jgi:intergrase/recombinase